MDKQDPLLKELLESEKRMTDSDREALRRFCQPMIDQIEADVLEELRKSVHRG